MLSTHNRSASLRRSLEALLDRQSVPGWLDYEVIVVDNNSSDDTRAAIEAARRRHPDRLRHLFEPRQGVSFGRNAGIAAARSPIVAFTDDDNEVEPDWVATIVTEMRAHPEVEAIGGRVLADWPASVPSWIGPEHWSPLAILDYGDQVFPTSRLNPRCLLTANLAVRREVFERIGGFSHAFPRCQDHEWLIRLWRQGGRALYAPSLVVRTRVPADRLTRRYHRAWHRRHGGLAATMRLQQVIDASGHLLPRPVDAVELVGSPLFVFRELLNEVGAWASAAARGRRRAAFHHANRVRYLRAYIRRGRTGRRSLAQDAAPLARWAATRLGDSLRPTRMRPSRLAVVHALIAVLVGASLYDVAADREDWPFSQYPMFSTVQREPALDVFRVFGVVSGTDGREIPLIAASWIEPFDQARLATAFARTVNNPSRRSLTEVMLRSLLDRYERRRQAGEHSGPPLRALRLYRLHWTLDPEGLNIDTPDRKELVASVDANLLTSRTP